MLLTLRLQFFAEDENGQEKTEEATPKKLEDARKEGQVARSQELTTAFALAALFIILKMFGGFISNRLMNYFNTYYSVMDVYTGGVFEVNYGFAFLRDTLVNILITCLPVYVSAFLVAFVVNVFQVKWKPTSKTLVPKGEKLNPIKGFKRMFSMDKLIELLKSVIKIGLILYISYDTLKDEVGTIFILYGLSELKGAVSLIISIVLNLGLKISLLYLIVGIADYIYQLFKFKNEMKMTKQEIKDEFKQTEGDAKVKGQIRQRMREASQRRMMQKLPEADVVITNPTHLACALKYDSKENKAPVLIAKGADFLAQRIKETARENDIPIVENKPLARMLYHNVEIDQEIPEELYQMVAEVLKYVYEIKGKAV